MLNLPKYIKSLRHQERHGALQAYGERQLSFDTTPVIHVRMHRPSSLRFKLPHIPCINPAAAQVDFDFDFNDDNDEGYYYDEVTRKSFLENADEEDDEYYGYDQVCEDKICEDDDDDDNKGIDMKAEEFIAKFYEQMKLQRQISYLQYHDKDVTV